MYDEWKEFDRGDGPYKIPFARFEEKEKEDFVFLLKDLPSNSIIPFLEDLAEVCYARKHLDGPGSAEEKRRYATPIIKNLRKNLAQLKSLRVSKLSIRDDIDLRPINKIWRGFQKTEIGFWENPCYDIEHSAQKAIPHITALIENLEKYLSYITQKRPGRKNADDSEFCYSIGTLFLKYFGEMPSADRNGVFSNVIKLSLETIGLPHDDPFRGISLAVARLKSEN